MSIVLSKKDLAEPGDHTAITAPPPPAPGEPWRVRWWYMNAAGEKKPDEAQSRKSPQDAYEKALAKVEAMKVREAGRAPDGETLLFTLLQKFLDSKINITAKSRTGYLDIIARIKLRLKDKDMMIGRIDFDEVQAAWSPKNGCTGTNTDEKAVAFLIQALEYARDTRKLSGPNPLKRLQCPRRLKKDVHTRAPYTKTDLEKVLTAKMTAEERLQWTLWFYSCWRIGEMCALRWSDRKTWGDFKDEAGAIVFENSTVPMLHLTGDIPDVGDDFRLKSIREWETGRCLTLTPYIAQLMREARAEQEARGYHGDVMFPAPEGGHYRPTRMRDRWYNPRLLRLGLASEVERPRKVVKRGKKVDKKIATQYVPHEVRHTGISMRAELKLSKYMDLEVGHTVPGVHAKYVNLDPESRLAESLLISDKLQEIASRGKNDGKALLQVVPLHAA